MLTHGTCDVQAAILDGFKFGHLVHLRLIGND